MNIQDWFSLGLIGLISLQSKGQWVSSKVLVILMVNTQSQEIYPASRFSKLFSWFCCLYWGCAGGKYVLSSLIAQMVKNLPAMQETLVQSLGQEDPLEKGMATHSSILAWRILWTDHGVAKSWTWLSDWTGTGNTALKNPPAIQETQVPSLGWEAPLEKGKATLSSILAWRIPRTVRIVHGVTKSQTRFEWLSLSVQ